MVFLEHEALGKTFGFDGQTTERDRATARVMLSVQVVLVSMIAVASCARQSDNRGCNQKNSTEAKAQTQSLKRK